MSDYVPASESMARLSLPSEMPLELREAIDQMATTGAPLGPPFDIPDFTVSGVLPPYMGTTPTAAALMSPYATTLARMRSACVAVPHVEQYFKACSDIGKSLQPLV